MVILHRGFSTFCTFPQAITPTGIVEPWTSPLIKILPRCQNSNLMLPFQKPFPTSPARSASSVSWCFVPLSTTFLTIHMFCLIACEQSIPFTEPVASWGRELLKILCPILCLLYYRILHKFLISICKVNEWNYAKHHKHIVLCAVLYYLFLSGTHICSNPLQSDHDPQLWEQQP